MEEEELFFKTLSSGIKIFEDNLPKKKSEMMSGEIAFKLHDTYGFPIDLLWISYGCHMEFLFCIFD